MKSNQYPVSDIQSQLNPEQRAAVTTTEGAVLVLSGAGTGKTTVLTRRIAYILSQELAQPWQILALTFTNKAAKEMKNRLGSIAIDIWCGTFHSVALKILRRESARAGLRSDFLIYGEDEQKTVLKNVFANMGLDSKTYNPGEWVEKISAIKDKGLGCQPDGKTEKIYDAYNAELARLNALDFGDIILKTLELFENALDVLERYQRQFKYIMVDEFQDTNNAQHQFLQKLVVKNICCVGDDDQSIYSWRGAEIKHILNFEKNYPGAKIIRLETNYRSTANILNAANSLIAHNTGRLGKDLRSAIGAGDGEKIYVMTLPTDWDEARMIAKAIEDARRKEQGASTYSDFAVLIRAGSLSRPFEEEFTARGIPYRLVGATKFYDRMEIRDAIAYIRLLVYQFDDLSFLRVIAKPRRGFGDAAIAKLRGFGNNLMSGLRAAPLAGKQQDAANEFIRAFDFNWESQTPADAAEHLLSESGYMKMWTESKETDAPDRISNIRELLGNVISKYDTLPEFLEHAALMMTDDNDNEIDKNAVSIMTIHAAKGLEFDTVFLPAWEEGIFPNEMAINEGGLEEERRLAYVAITRAKRRAVISNAMKRVVFGEAKYNIPSRFINEIDKEFVDDGFGLRDDVKKNITRQPSPIIHHPSSIVGKLVSNAEMGKGVVIEDGGEVITVAFRDKGIKKVARKFVEFEKVEV